MFFRELGATVIKVENKKTGGDVTRNWRLPTESPDSQSAYYSSVNWKKETRFLDLSSKEDYREILKEIRTADIVLSNFRPASAKKLKLDFSTLKNENQKLIYAELTGFEKGNSRPAFDVVLQAETGFLFMCGNQGKPPVKMPVALIDLLAAHQLKEGILTALFQREKTGMGSKVSASLYESAVASLANQATNWLMGNHIPQPMGTQHPNIAPYGDLFKTADMKSIVLAVGNEKQFKNLCGCLNLHELAFSNEFSTNKKRVENRTALISILGKVISKMSFKKLSSLFLEKDVPFGHVKNMAEVFENETAKRLILEEEIEPTGQKTQRVKTIVFSISDKE